MESPLTTSQVARTLSESPLLSGTIAEWQVRRIFELGILPEPAKFGGKRMVPRGTLPSIVKAMQTRGWLHEPEAVS